MKKKTLTIIMLALVMCLSLTGCFKADTKVNLALDGGVSVDLTYLTTLDQLKENFGVEDYDSYMDEQIKALNAEFEQGIFTGVESLKVEKAVDGDMYGVNMKVSAESFDKFSTSPYFPSFFQLCPMSVDGNPETTISVTTKASPFGTAYLFSGKFDLASIFASIGFDVSEGKEGTSTLTISSPIPFSTKTFVATTTTPAMVEYSTFVPNIAVLIMSLLIILLAIFLAIFAVKYSKLKKSLEAPAEEAIEYDEFGNPIVNEVEEELAEEIEKEEVTEEVSEETAENIEEVTEETTESEEE